MTTLVSEKAAEILFNRYMLQSLRRQGAQFFAPTTVEEFRCGYDSKVVGFGAMRELFLQFKAPTYSKRDQRFSVTLTEHQHATLLRYSGGSAFYVVGMFTSLAQFNQAQRTSQDSADFLLNFFCLDAASLPPGTRAFTFGVPASHRHSPEPGLKDARHGKGPTDLEPLPDRAWLRGSTLIDKLKNGDIGRVLTLAEGTAHLADRHRLETSAATDPGLKDSDVKTIGCMVRLPLQNDQPLHQRQGHASGDNA